MKHAHVNEEDVKHADLLVQHGDDEAPEKCGVGRLKHRHPPKRTVPVKGRGKTVLLEPETAMAYQRQPAAPGSSCSTL
jgi:hypothetical protein